MFRVEFRQNCKICGSLITEAKFRTFCSKQCRTRSYNIKKQGYSKQWQRQDRARKNRPGLDKKRCIICGLWFVQVGSHIVQIHEMTARQYREKFNLPVKRGITAQPYRELKATRTIRNGTARNLFWGVANWYKKGDKRAKAGKKIHPWKGMRGVMRPIDEYYG